MTNKSQVKRRPPSLSELTPMVFNTGLTHSGSDIFEWRRKLLLSSFAILNLPLSLILWVRPRKPRSCIGLPSTWASTKPSVRRLYRRPPLRRWCRAPARLGKRAEIPVRLRTAEIPDSKVAKHLRKAKTEVGKKEKPRGCRIPDLRAPCVSRRVPCPPVE